MKCHSAQRGLSAERDGTLTNAERVDLDEHLAACAECRQARAVIAAAVDRWKAAQAQIPVPDEERAWQDIRREIHARAPVQRRGNRSLMRWTLTLSAAAALACGVIFVPRGTNDTKPPEIARADFVETAAGSSSLVYLDDKSGWLVVWAVDDTDKL